MLFLPHSKKTYIHLLNKQRKKHGVSSKQHDKKTQEDYLVKPILSYKRLNLLGRKTPSGI